MRSHAIVIACLRIILFFGIGLWLWTAATLHWNVSAKTEFAFPDGLDYSLFPEGIGTGLARFGSNSNSNTFRHNHNFTVAICAVVKDGEAYLQEWLDFHLAAMGFDHIFLYDHSRGFELQRWFNNTRNHPVYKRVTILPLEDDGKREKDGLYIQNWVYKDCVQRFGVTGPKHDYMAFIDEDEFFVLQQDSASASASPRYSTIHDVLETYLVPFGGALVVNWSLFGTANKTVYAPLPVSKRFQYRVCDVDGAIVESGAGCEIVKSIVKSSDYEYHRNPHAVHLLDNKRVRTLTAPGHVHPEALGKTGASCKRCGRDVLLVHHYKYTSLKEYVQKKCLRGNIDVGNHWCREVHGIVRNGPLHIRPKPGIYFDDRAWKFLTSRVPAYKMYDNPHWKDYT